MIVRGCYPTVWHPGTITSYADGALQNRELWMTVSDAANRQTIADHYRGLILAGDLGDGAALPPVVDIAQAHGVSKDVVTRAFRLLQSDGLIRVGRKGALVSSGESLPFNTMTPTAPGTKAYPLSDGLRVVAAGLVPAQEYVAVELSVEPLSAVVRRAHVRLQGNLPVIYTVSWLHADLVKSVPELVSIGSTEGTYELIHRATGHTVTSGVDQVYARGAASEIARELGVGEGAPLLAGCTRWSDDLGTIVEFAEFFVPADRRLTFTYNT